MNLNHQIAIRRQVFGENRKHFPKTSIAFAIIPGRGVQIGLLHLSFGDDFFQDLFVELRMLHPIKEAKVPNADDFGMHIFLMHEIDHFLTIYEGDFVF
ncbi:MAG TPA: hypothetical protein VLE95_02730 [Chlamydiales bacterium]|nr:hypothetical protein [Chlamydiales bacterium]